MRRLWLWLARYPELRRSLLLWSDPLISLSLAQALLAPPKRKTVQGTTAPHRTQYQIRWPWYGSST